MTGGRQGVLVSWIGANDLKALTGEHSGPLAAMLSAVSFDEVHLLYNYPKKEVAPYIAWLKGRTSATIEARKVKLKSPVDYHDIYLAADGLLNELAAIHAEPLAILLSPGTPAMQAVWVLLGKTRYPVRFYQSSLEAGVQEVGIPFEISAEFLPKSPLNGEQYARMVAGAVPVNAAFDDIATQNPRMQELKAQASILAAHDVPVLVYGESGTGKELFATAIHNASPRARKAFIAVNCGAIAPELIDSALFGHIKGSFTGAISDHAGYFRQADGGTLFLDEFGELPPPAQVRLLRALQSGEVTPVGAAKPLKVDVRIVAATNRDLMGEVVAGRFREDLFYRIAVGILHLPPLRQRQGDISLLADQLLDRLVADLKLPDNKKISTGAKKFILKHEWPGNVRELQATLLRALLWSSGSSISAEDLQQALFVMPEQKAGILGRDISQGIDIKEIISEVVQHYVPRALAEANQSKTRAAQLLGLVNYQTLDSWMEKHNVK